MIRPQHAQETASTKTSFHIVAYKINPVLHFLGKFIITERLQKTTKTGQTEVHSYQNAKETVIKGKDAYEESNIIRKIIVRCVPILKTQAQSVVEQEGFKVTPIDSCCPLLWCTRCRRSC